MTVEEFDLPLVTLLFPEDNETLTLEVAPTLGATTGLDIRDLNLVDFHWD